MKNKLRVEATSMFSSTFAVTSKGREVGRVQLAWRDKGRITIDGVRMDVERQGFIGVRWRLVYGGRAIATASKKSFSRQVDVEFGGDAYQVMRVGMFRRAIELRRGSRVLGEIRPAGFFGRTLLAEFDEGVDLQLQLFACWVALVLRRRARGRGASPGAVQTSGF